MATEDIVTRLRRRWVDLEDGNNAGTARKTMKDAALEIEQLRRENNLLRSQDWDALKALYNSRLQQKINDERELKQGWIDEYVKLRDINS